MSQLSPEVISTAIHSAQEAKRLYPQGCPGNERLTTAQYSTSLIHAVTSACRAEAERVSGCLSTYAAVAVNQNGEPPALHRDHDVKVFHKDGRQLQRQRYVFIFLMGCNLAATAAVCVAWEKTGSGAVYEFPVPIGHCWVATTQGTGIDTEVRYAYSVRHTVLCVALLFCELSPGTFACVRSLRLLNLSVPQSHGIHVMNNHIIWQRP